MTSSASTFEEGTVSRVVWASADSGWAILRVRTDQGEITAVGPLAGLGGGEGTVGAFVGLEGRWEDHPSHGPQFRTVGYVEGSPRSVEGIRLYLEGVPGIGPKLAARVTDQFGIDTLRVLSKTPWRLSEVKGIKSKAKDIAEHWARDENGRALTIRLRSLGLGPRLIDRLRRRYGEQARAIVDREPYRLAEEISGIGFRTADALARAAGLAEDHPGRVRAALLHALDPDNTDGDCYLTRAVAARAVAALGVPVTGLDAAIDGLTREGRVVVEAIEPSPDGFQLPPPHAEDRVWTRAIYVAECDVAAQLRERLVDAPPPPEAEATVLDAERRCGVTLDPTQREAVIAALGGGVRVITGGPGTGKTTLVRVLLAAARAADLDVRLASPTGRAAKRLSEATGGEATTLHRLLEFNPGEGGFQRNAGNPLDGDLLVVDETSMVDLPLLQALLAAIPADPAFPLIFVGDHDQLPSVGPGRILGDLVDSGVVPVVRLGRVYRQGARSGILDAAARIHAGSPPLSGEQAGFDDCFLIAREDPERVVEAVLQIAADRLAAKGFDPLQDVQILAPTRKGSVGTEALNLALQARLNPDGAPIARGGRTFRVRDRVICTKNRYDLEVFNGDVGTVVGTSGADVVLSFDRREVIWPVEDLGQIDLAYAMTVHKSQGSEYAAVVLVLHAAHSVMLRRNLFYTAVTRARRFLCVVGTPRSWARAAADIGGGERATGLAARLRAPAVEVPDDLDPPDFFEAPPEPDAP